MNVIELLESWLISTGYDGLCNPDAGCGCRIGNLMPCYSFCGHCQPGHLHPGEEFEWGWDILIVKPGETDETQTVVEFQKTV